MVLRRWDLNRILIASDIDRAITELLTWPLKVVEMRGLFTDVWKYRANLTFPDTLYIALAEHLGGTVLTDDRRQANTPNLPVTTLHLP